MSTQPDHATEAAELLANDRADVATAHPGGYVPEPEPVVVSEPEVAIRGGRLTRVTDELRAQVANMHRPAPDCGKGFVECIQTLLAYGYTASPDREGDQ